MCQSQIVVFYKTAASDRQGLVKTSKNGIKVTEVTLIHYGTDRYLIECWSCCLVKYFITDLLQLSDTISKRKLI